MTIDLQCSQAKKKLLSRSCTTTALRGGTKLRDQQAVSVSKRAAAANRLSMATSRRLQQLNADGIYSTERIGLLTIVNKH